jgi:biotin transport system substrate-specific component
MMNDTLSFKSSLQNILISTNDSIIRKALLGLAGMLVLAVASQLTIPLQPVPLTFQSTTVILLGMTYGARYGAYIMLAYLAAGVMGMPLFAEFRAGPQILLGPTGGYLIGFVPAAFVSGYLAQVGFAKNIFLSFVAAFIGTAIIFGCGLLQLSTLMSWQAAIAVGVTPFLISELTKLVIVAYLIPKVWKTA